MRKSKKTRDQLLRELRNAYEGGASIRNLAATTGRSYGSIHSMLRESGTTMRGRGGPNRRSRPRWSADCESDDATAACRVVRFTVSACQDRRTEFSTRSRTAASRCGSSPEASRASNPSSTRSR